MSSSLPGDPRPSRPDQDDLSPSAADDLRSLLEQAATEPPACISAYVSRVFVGCAILGLVAEAHAQGRIHGDLRPENIHVSAHGVVTIEGWGGTPSDAARAAPYRAPELVGGAAPTVASDIYAIGAVFWELLTLRPTMMVEENLTRFWRRRKGGELDPLPAEVGASVPATLLAAAKQALDPDPQLRWHSADEFRTVISGWLNRIESVAITLQAESELAATAIGKGQAPRAARQFQSALELWPQNAAAQQGLATAGTVQAVAAIHDEDEAGARRFLEGDSGSDHVAVKVELTRLHRRNRRRRSLRVYALVAVVALVLAGVWGWLAQRQRAVSWRPEAEWVLGRGASTVGLELSRGDVDEHLPIDSPAAPGLMPPIGGIVWLTEVDSCGDVRLGIDAEWTQRIDGLELMLGAPRTAVPHSQSQPGYTCQFGGFKGTQTFLSASQAGGMLSRPAPIAFAFEPRRVYRLELERRDETLRMLVDGRMVWEQREIIPIGDSSFRWLALRAWTEVRVHRISVEKPLVKPTLSPLSTADGLVATGHLADALNAYQNTLRFELSPGQYRQAIAKAHVIASRLPNRAKIRLALLALAERDLPAESPYLLDVLQSEALCLWRDRDWLPALDMARRIQSSYPHSRCALSLLEQRISKVPENAVHGLLELIATGPPVSHLDLGGLELTDLSALRGLRPVSLDIRHNRIADLGPLAGMPLRYLDCQNNQIDDLGPLGAMPLVDLNASHNRISDVTALAKLPLESLSLNNNQVSDLAPIAQPALRRLYLDHNPIVSLRPLARCQQLTTLSVSDAPLTDLEGLPLESLTDLAVVRCPVSDVRSLANSHLIKLNLVETLVEDVSPLPRGTLTRLQLDKTRVASLAGLKGMKLAQLGLSNTPIASLEGVAGLGLDEKSALDLSLTAIDSLAPLADLTLGTLRIDGTRVRDLGPLATCRLGKLYADEIPAEDPSPLGRNGGLQRITLWRSGAPPAGLDALADTIENAGGPAMLVNDLRIQAAVAASDWRRLRAMARRIGSSDRLITNIRATLPDATALASAAGAHLPCFTDRGDLLAVYTQPGREGWSWSGLRPSPGAGQPPIWDNGRSDERVFDLISVQPLRTNPAVWVIPNSPHAAVLRPTTQKEIESLRQVVILEW